MCDKGFLEPGTRVCPSSQAQDDVRHQTGSISNQAPNWEHFTLPVAGLTPSSPLRVPSDQNHPDSSRNILFSCTDPNLLRSLQVFLPALSVAHLKPRTTHKTFTVKARKVNPLGQAGQTGWRGMEISPAVRVRMRLLSPTPSLASLGDAPGLV